MSEDPGKSVVRVLFVEDAFDQALLVKAFLQAAPGEFQITHSQDGDHAVRLLREREWDLLITDLNLPGIDGFDVCRIAKSLYPTLPILAVTGYTGAHYQEEAFRAGANDLMMKPIDKDDFIRKVGELTGTRAAPQRAAVVAVGGLVGDAEMGCAGALMKHRQDGADVVIVPLCRDDMDPTNSGLECALNASKRIGARLMVDELAMEDTQRRVEFLQRVARDLQPQIAYIPAMDDQHPARREAFRIAKASFGTVPLVLGYQTATTGLDFKPTRMEDIADFMMDKMEALTAYQGQGAVRMDLAPRMAQAYGRYWGRFQRFGEVEAFEVVRGG